MTTDSFLDNKFEVLVPFMFNFVGFPEDISSGGSHFHICVYISWFHFIHLIDFVPGSVFVHLFKLKLKLYLLI